MSILGIKNTDLIIIYDNTAFFSSARAWWMFKVFGHKKVLILNGGLKAWVENGGKVSNEVNPYNKTNYVNLSYEEKLCENFENIFDNINSNYDRVIIDARARERFCGRVNEPRPGLRKGHIPTYSLPFFFKTTCSPTTSTISTRSFTDSIVLGCSRAEAI